MDTVAVLGASADRSKFGNKAVRAFLSRGYAVYPVNPRATTIEGLLSYPSILMVPIRPKLVSVYLRPEILLPLLPDVAQRGCDEIWLNPGTCSDEVIAAIRKIGINALELCSIVALGLSPADL